MNITHVVISRMSFCQKRGNKKNQFVVLIVFISYVERHIARPRAFHPLAYETRWAMCLR